jgi:hypothetical protein
MGAIMQESPNTSTATSGEATPFAKTQKEDENVKDFGDLVASLVAILFMPALLLGLSQVLANVFTAAAVFIYAVPMLVSLWVMFWLAFDRAAGESNIMGGAQLGGWLLLYFVFGFGQLCRYFNLSYGGFSVHTSGYWTWSLYGVSWILDNFTANLGQIFGWNVTDIGATSFAARTLTWAFNICVDLFAVAAFLRYAPVLVGRWRRS